MSVPDLVRDYLSGESIEAEVGLGDDDELLVTPTRTLIYRAEGLIRDATVEEYSHDAESVAVSESRRTSTIQLDHGIDGESELSVPTSHLEEILPPVLGGVLRAGGVLESGERIEDVYRLGELTLIIAEGRVIKHVGNGLWDADAEVYDFERTTGVDIERGEVSSQIIVELDGRPQRIKVPTGDAREIRERIERALLSYHDAGSYEEFERQQGETEPADRSETTAVEGDASTSGIGDGITFETGAETGAGNPGPATAGTESETTPGGDTGAIAREVAELREAVERQTELIESQQRTIQQLIKELRNR